MVNAAGEGREKAPRDGGVCPLQGVRAHGDQLPLILRDPPILRESGPRGKEFQEKESTSHLPRSSHPRGPNLRLPKALHLPPSPAASAYRFPLLSRQAPEASLSLKTLGEKNHEKLQERAVSTQPLTPPCSPPALCPHSRQRWGATGGPPSVPSKVTIGGVPRRVTIRGVNPHVRVPQKHAPQDRSPQRYAPSRVTPRWDFSGGCHWCALL